MQTIAGRFELGDLIGSGGFASVYRGRDLETSRIVAIKVIGEGNTNPALADRFRHEALALSRLASANIARVYDFGRDERHGLYLVMELIDGVSLDVFGMGRALSEPEVIVAGRALLSALSAAHTCGIVHRDIKPANVVVPGGITGLNALKLLDFGIAREERRSEIQAALGATDTLEGQAIGTPAYMAPEQLTMDQVGPAADVYSAGLVLFELLDRGTLHSGTTTREQLVQRLTEAPILSGRVGPELGGLLSRMLARDPGARFSDGTAALLAFASVAPSSDERVTSGVAVGHACTEVSSNLMTAPAPPGSRRSLVDRTQKELTRLWSLDRDPLTAFTRALQDLDLPMLDALGRRERGTEIGAVAKAVAAALRLDLRGAAELLAPELDTSPLAQAVGSTLIAPTARTSLSERVDRDPQDGWVDRIDPVIGATLCGLWFSLGGRDQMERVGARCMKLADRLVGAERDRVRLLGSFAAAMLGTEPMGRVIADARADTTPAGPLETFIRSHGLGVVAFRADEHLAREQLEVACRVGVETGAVLLEARALSSWSGALLSARPEHAKKLLTRATALLSGGDATRLEQIAALNLGSALALARRYADAIPYLEQAHALGEEEGRHENAALAAASLLHSALTQNDEALHSRAKDRLSVALTYTVTPRARAHAETGLALLAARNGDLAGAELLVQSARSHAQDAGLAGTDAWLIAEVTAIVVCVARGERVDLLERAGALEHMASSLGFASFNWFDSLIDALECVPDVELQNKLLAPARRLVVLLHPKSH